MISSSRYVAILFILRLWEVRGSDDFVTKYDTCIYNSVCKKNGVSGKTLQGKWYVLFYIHHHECTCELPIKYLFGIHGTWCMYLLEPFSVSTSSSFFFFGGGGYLSLLTCLYVSPLPVKHGGGGGWYSFYRGLPVILSPLRFPYFSLYGSANWFQTFWVAS